MVGMSETTPQEPGSEVPVDGAGDDPLTRGQTLVLVSAVWCGVDRAVREILASIPLPPGVRQASVDVDRDPQTADRFSVQTLPTVLWVSEGRVVTRLHGSFGKADIERFMRDCTESTHSGT